MLPSMPVHRFNKILLGYALLFTNCQKKKKKNSYMPHALHNGPHQQVKPDLDNTGNLAMSIIHLDSMVHGAHLMGIAGTHQIPHHLTFNRSLDAFEAFYVNKYVDHHAHKYAF